MAQHLTLAQAFKSKTLSLPQHLAVLAMAVGTVRYPGEPVRYDSPKGMELSSLERAEAKTLLSRLTSLLDPEAPFEIEGNSFPGRAAKGAILTKMIRGLAGPAKQSDVAANAKVDVYGDAIDDLPAWTVDAALKRWCRAECPQSIEASPEYAFPPSPATLRRMALFDLEGIKRDSRLLENLIAAVPTADAMQKHSRPSSDKLPALRRM